MFKRYIISNNTWWAIGHNSGSKEICLQTKYMMGITTGLGPASSVSSVMARNGVMKAPYIVRPIIVIQIQCKSIQIQLKSTIIVWPIIDYFVAKVYPIQYKINTQTAWYFILTKNYLTVHLLPFIGTCPEKCTVNHNCPMLVKVNHQEN